ATSAASPVVEALNVATASPPSGFSTTATYGRGALAASARGAVTETASTLATRAPSATSCLRIVLCPSRWFPWRTHVRDEPPFGNPAAVPASGGRPVALRPRVSPGLPFRGM